MHSHEYLDHSVLDVVPVAQGPQGRGGHQAAVAPEELGERAVVPIPGLRDQRSRVSGSFNRGLHLLSEGLAWLVAGCVVSQVDRAERYDPLRAVAFGPGRLGQLRATIRGPGKSLTEREDCPCCLLSRVRRQEG